MSAIKQERQAKIVRKNVLAFVAAASIPSTIITLTYLTQAYKMNQPKDVAVEDFGIILPIAFGIFGVINYNVVKEYGKNASLLVGVLVGLVYSIFGRFYLGLPKKLFKFKEDEEWKVHVYAGLIIYPLLFRFVITELTCYLLDDPVQE